MRTIVAAVVLWVVASGAWCEEKAAVVQATFLVNGLHCPPCTRTVEKSLAPLPGVAAASVDWKTKSARLQFDPARTSPAQIAQRIAATPHMMGARMKYAGWLALAAPQLKDEAGAAKAKGALLAVEGIAQVAAYPQQGMVAVRFSGSRDIGVQDLVAALAAAGFEAHTY